ncbi:hypothetical protein [Kitasatospora sp. NPDC059803]|uniref:hypothetical protein n=1 Tax=Kitasatospora sp. NPDC059803 TaxID=3346953 RepID=UPI00364F3109
MPYAYRCGSCSASSPPGRHEDAVAARDEHRRTTHGGLIPDGESITEVDDPDRRGLDPKAVAAFLGLGVLAALYRWITH